MPVDEKTVLNLKLSVINAVRVAHTQFRQPLYDHEVLYQDGVQAAFAALLDEKDAQIAALSEALTKANRVSDEALSRIAELEAAIGESVRRADLHWNAVRTVEPLRPFVKQPSDPLEEVCKELGIEPQAWMEASARHGLTITEVKG